MEGEEWCISFLIVVWLEETIPKQWKEGLIVRRGVRKILHGNYRGMENVS